jgi:hypothetical protein
MLTSAGRECLREMKDEEETVGIYSQFENNKGY